MPESKSSPEDLKLMDALMKRAVRDALRVHKALGHTVAVWRDGKVVDVPAEDIDVVPVEEDPFPLKSGA